MENIKKKQMEIHREAENTITKIKISVDGLNSRKNISQERVSELEDMSVESIQSEEERQRVKKNEEGL